MSLTSERLNTLLDGTGIEVSNIQAHSKASESYIDVRIADLESDYVWVGTIPYFYRRTGLFLETEEAIAAYLLTIRQYFKPQFISEWIEAEKAFWAEKKGGGGDVTPYFFDVLATLEWVKGDEFPANANPQSRIKAIKDMGYTVATRNIGRVYERLLVPIPRGAAIGYELFSKAFKSKALKVLKYMNAYELSTANKAGLILDHKFPEIRWDQNTKDENPENMSDNDIKEKFQLVDNQRNQQKREVCRSCFQTDKRGILFGIKFFYQGDENWPPEVPKVGKQAEQGCIGCGWYDIPTWRDKLNGFVSHI